MTIDNLIEKLKSDSIMDSYNFQGYSMKQKQQIAGWLEELKEARKGFEENRKAGYEHGYSDGYAKAIDEFAEKIALETSESIIWGMLVDSDKDNSFSDTADKIVDYVIDNVKRIAVQMKGGAE